METPNLIFKTYKARCSSLGHLMTSLPQPMTFEERAELKDLLNELETGVNANGRKTKWSDTKAKRVNSLQKKEKGIDELPAGAITHCNNIFRSVFWGRKRLLNNKFLMKGNLVEDDSIGLISKYHGEFFVKNKKHISDEFLQGTPDVVNPLFDTKSNYDFDTFESAELTSLYEWQVRGYAKIIGLTGGTLSYCLVNSPIEIIDRERKSLFFAMGAPDEENADWKCAVRQLEINHIFDVPAFKKLYPHYTFENEDTNFSIPAELRVKEFEVTVSEKNAEDIERRVMMARVYLCEKESAIYQRFPELQQKAVEYYKNLNQ